MTPCDVDALSAYLDGELSLQQRRDLERHLRGCARCGEELRELRQMDRLLVSWGARRRPMPLDTERRIQETVERRRSIKPVVAVSRMMPAALGTCVAAVLVLISANFNHVYVPNQSEPVGTYAAATKQIIQKREAPLVNRRRASAVLGNQAAASPRGYPAGGVPAAGTQRRHLAPHLD